MALKTTLITLCLSVLFSIRFVHAYPNFIGKGYGSCLTCHYNPFGNGPLTDYGRAVSANAIAGRFLVSDKTSDEQLSQRSGFLFNQPNPNQWVKVRPAIDYRGLYLKADVDDPDSKARYIHMQMDGGVTLSHGDNNQYVLTTTYAVIPDNSSRTGEEEKFVREQYLGVRITKELGAYLGKMDKVFGLRVPDHTAVSRSPLKLGQYDQVDGLMIHYGNPKMDAGIHVYNGNAEKEKELQDKGFSGKFEYFVADNIRLGLSHLAEKRVEDKNEINALIAKIGVREGSSIMVELGQQTKTPEGAQKPTNYQYLFMQNHILIKRGLYFLTTFEQVKPDTTATTEIYKITPGFQWFPLQRVELRAELGNVKIFSDESVTEDTWNFLGQIHLWF